MWMWMWILLSGASDIMWRSFIQIMIPHSDNRTAHIQISLVSNKSKWIPSGIKETFSSDRIPEKVNLFSDHMLTRSIPRFRPAVYPSRCHIHHRKSISLTSVPDTPAHLRPGSLHNLLILPIMKIHQSARRKSIRLNSPRRGNMYDSAYAIRSFIASFAGELHNLDVLWWFWWGRKRRRDMFRWDREEMVMWRIPVCGIVGSV